MRWGKVVRFVWTLKNAVHKQTGGRTVFASKAPKLLNKARNIGGILPSKYRADK